MAVEYFQGVTQEELEGALRQICGHPGIRAPYERPNGYQNGSEMVLYPYFRLVNTRKSLVEMGAVVLVSHECNILDDEMGTGRPLKLIAPTDVINQVKSLASL